MDGFGTEAQVPNDARARDRQWKPFAPGNQVAKGRESPRNRLAKKLLTTLEKDFNEHGEAAVAELRETDPGAYLRVVASLIPREVHVTVDPIDELTDDDLDRYIRQLANNLHLQVGAGQSIESETPALAYEPPGDL